MLKITFYLLIAVFVGIVNIMIFSPSRGNVAAIFITSWAAFFLLGGLLIYLTLKQKIKERLKTFLILTGASAAGFLIFVILHNLLYALAIVAKDIIVIKYLAEALHVLFFLTGTLACPIGFLIGAVGSIVLFIKGKD